MTFRKIRKGSALLMSIIVLATLSAWAVSIYSVSGTNLQLAENQRKADSARACAESGHEIMRFWLNQFAVSGEDFHTSPSLVFPALQSGGDSLLTILSASAITNITPYNLGSKIVVPAVTLDSATGKSFSAEITAVGTDAIWVDVTGMCGSVTKTIRVKYTYDVRRDTVFDFGVATRGPLHLSGNIELSGVNISVDSDVFIESPTENEALSIIGNSEIAGEVKITNPDAYVTMQGGQASIGGETGEAALNHVTIGYEAPEFPAPNPDCYVSYATNVINSSTDLSASSTYDNIFIAAGTNPIFNNDVTLRGIVYIEQPNIVTFAGNATVTGIVVGGGDITDDSATNQINFLGTVTSMDVNQLPQESQFEGLHDEQGTFVMAPGFHVGFGGNFGTLNGAIAGNGIDFFGNAGGTINGSVINYSGSPMNLEGNNSLFFNRSGTDKVPAGFLQDIILSYDAESYTEVVL
jgi:hypothetical protein